MAITQGNQTLTTYVRVGTTTVTISHNNNGDYLLVTINAGFSHQDPNGATYNGVSMTKIVTQTNVDGGRRDTAFELVAPASGTHNVVITYPSDDSGAFIGITSYSGVDQTAPLRNFTSGRVSGTNHTLTVTTVSGDRCVLGVVGDGSDTYTAGSGVTLEGQGGDGVNFNGAQAYKDATTTSTTVNVTTSGSRNSAITLMAIAPATVTVQLSDEYAWAPGIAQRQDILFV